MLGTLKINKPHTTLVDQVEESLIEYFKEQGLRPGSSIPPEAELANALGVARTVLRRWTQPSSVSSLVMSSSRLLL